MHRDVNPAHICYSVAKDGTTYISLEDWYTDGQHYNPSGASSKEYSIHEGITYVSAVSYWDGKYFHREGKPARTCYGPTGEILSEQWVHHGVSV
jgi:hypothetical protein